MMMRVGVWVVACALAGTRAYAIEPRDSVAPPTSVAKPGEPSSSHTTTPSRGATWPISFDAGLEIGRTSARAQGLDSLLYMATTSGFATTVSGDATLTVGRTQWVGQSGVSTARGEYGGYSRLVGVLLSDGMMHLRAGWMLSGDFTYVASSGVPSATSGGVAAYVGRPDVVQAGIRVGERWRAESATPVYTMELSHMSAIDLHGVDASVTASVTGTRTSYTGSRLNVDVGKPIELYRLSRERVPATLADLRLRPRVARGAWSAELEATTRVGRAATLWDDPVARYPNGTPTEFTPIFTLAQDPLSIQRDQHDRVGLVLRAAWQITPAWSLAGEGGRRMSDPFSGVTGMRYVGVSMRIAMHRARNAVDAYLDHAPAVTRPASPEPGVSVLVVERDPTETTSVSDSTMPLREVVVRGVAGAQIDVAGDFTSWQPVALRRCVVKPNGAVRQAGPDESIHPDAFVWCGRFSMTPGAHHLVVRIDGGDWHPPIGVPVVSDSFDGTVGLLIVL